MQTEFLRFPAVHRIVQLSRSTIWRMEQGGVFPRRRQISANTVGWLRSEIESWTDERQLAGTERIAGQSWSEAQDA